MDFNTTGRSITDGNKEKKKRRIFGPRRDEII
jgi:hypothetical protein